MTAQVRPNLAGPVNEPSAIATVQRFGNQAAQRLLRSGIIQAKLAVSKPGDAHEQEADRVADAVMRIPEPRAATQRASITGPVQPAKVQRLCTECKEDEEGASIAEETTRLIDTKAVSGQTPALAPNTSAQLGGLNGGHPLPESARHFFEPRFNATLGNVRLHHDGHAAALASSIHARAFTLGRDIVFGQSQYSPDSHGGRFLLAHELTHVMQQSRGGASAREVHRQVDFSADWANVTVENGAAATIDDGTFSYHHANFGADASITATADTAAELNDWDVGVFQDLLGHWHRIYWARENTDGLGRFVERKYQPVNSGFRDQVNGATTVWYADDEHQLLSGLAPTAAGARQQVTAAIHHRDFPAGQRWVSGSAAPGMDASDGDHNANIQRSGARFDAWIAAHNTVTDEWRPLRRVNWNYQRTLDFTGSGATLAIGTENWLLGSYVHGARGAAPLMAGELYNTVLNDAARYQVRRVNGWT